MPETIATTMVELQENGIIRNSDGVIIGRLSPVEEEKKIKVVMVRYLGCTDEQANWFQSMDPRKVLIENKEYEITGVTVNAWHTLYFLKGFGPLGFNSVCFEDVEETR